MPLDSRYNIMEKKPPMSAKPMQARPMSAVPAKPQMSAAPMAQKPGNLARPAMPVAKKAMPTSLPADRKKMAMQNMVSKFGKA